jgi:tetratricopeptide (TPR) repeat protein
MAAGKKQSVTYQVNYWLLGSSLLGLLAVGGGLYLWYGMAMQRVANQFLERGRESLAEASATDTRAQQAYASGQLGDFEELRKAARKQRQDANTLLFQYLILQPDDLEVRRELATAYSQLPEDELNPQRALELFRGAFVSATPEQTWPMRVQLARILNDSREWNEAEVEARVIIAAERQGLDVPKEVADQAWGELAISLAGQLRRDGLPRSQAKLLEFGEEVGSVFTVGYQRNPSEWRLAVNLADLYRSELGPSLATKEQQQGFQQNGSSLTQTADDLVFATIAKHPDNYRARLAGFAYRAQHQLPGAEVDLEAAAKLRPYDAGIQAMVGLWHLEQIPVDKRGQLLSGGQSESLTEVELKHLAVGTSYLAKAVEFGVVSSEPFSGLADAYLLQNQPELALKTWEKGVEVAATSAAPLYQRLIVYHLSKEQYENAEQRLQQWRQKTQAESRNRNVDPRALNEALRTQDLMQGLLQLQQQQIEQAVATFEALISADGRRGPRVVEIYDILGRTFAGMNSVARAAHYFEQAALLAPDNSNILRQAAQTRLSLGQLELARGHLERLLGGQPKLEDWLTYAQLLYRIQLQRPAAERQWLVVETALERAKQAAERESRTLEDWQWLWSALVLEQTPETWSPPTKLSGKEPPEFLQAIAQWYEEAGDSARAAAVTETMISSRETPFEQAVAKIQVLASQGEWAAATEAVSTALTTWTEPEQQQNLRLLWAQLELNQGLVQEAWQRLEALLRDFPEDKRVCSIMANAAIEMNRIEESPAWWEAKLVVFEGADGPLQRYLAAERSLRIAEKSTDESLARSALGTAESLIREALAAQSRWARGLTLMARIRDQQLRMAISSRNLAEATNLRQQARQLYQQAYEYGDRAPQTLLRLSDLTDDPDEAARILGQLGDETIQRFDPLLTQMIGLRMESGNLKSAEEMALAATKSRPGEPSAWLSLAAVYLRQGRLDEADQVVQSAEQLARTQPAPRVPLMSVFQFHLLASRMAGSTERRNTVIKRARDLVDPLVNLETGDQQLFYRGLLLDSLGDDEAARWYLQFEQKNPTDPEQLGVILDYFVRRNVPGVDSQETAIRLANKLLELRPDSIAYKTQLSQLLMARGREEDWAAASKLMGTSAEFGPETPRGRRTQAIMLWDRREVPRDTRIKNLNSAISLLNQVTTSNEVVANDHILLGNVYREMSEWVSETEDKNRHQELKTLALESLARASQFGRLENDQLLMLAMGLIDLESWDQAERTIERLVAGLETQKLPNPSPIALKISLWQRRGEENVAERAEPMVTEFIEKLDAVLPLLDDLQKARIFVQVASIWEMLKKPDLAIEWFRKAAGLNPDLLATMTTALVRDGQKKSALEVCQQAFEAGPSVQLVSLFSYVLITGRTSDEEFALAEPMIKAAQEKFSNDVTVLGSLANIRSVQPGQTAAAIELYLAGLKINPNQFVLLNNLATLYGEIPERREEALKLVDRAVGIAGDIPALLNTKARILTNQGKHAESQRLLQSIVRRDADPRYWWQLAEVELKLFESTASDGNRKASLAAWQEALKNGIEAATLTPEEYVRMEAFRSQLAKLAN